MSKKACSSVCLQEKLNGEKECQGLNTERPVGPGHDKIMPLKVPRLRPEGNGELAKGFIIFFYFLF